MGEKPKSVYYLVLLLITLFLMFVIWGWYAEAILVNIPSWTTGVCQLEPSFAANLYWIFLIGTILWFGSAGLMLIIAYGLIKKKHWAWTTAMIINSLCLFAFGIMLAAFMVAVLIFQDLFSITGIVTSVLALIVDIAIVYLLTRNETKKYYNT
jgi:hypothetical protein